MPILKHFEKLCCRLLKCKQWYLSTKDKEQFKPQMYKLFEEIDSMYLHTENLELRKQMEEMLVSTMQM